MKMVKTKTDMTKVYAALVLFLILASLIGQRAFSDSMTTPSDPQTLQEVAEEGATTTLYIEANGAVLNEALYINNDTSTKTLSFSDSGTEHLYIEADGDIFATGELTLRPILAGASNAAIKIVKGTHWDNGKLEIGKNDGTGFYCENDNNLAYSTCINTYMSNTQPVAKLAMFQRQNTSGTNVYIKGGSIALDVDSQANGQTLIELEDKHNTTTVIDITGNNVQHGSGATVDGGVISYEGVLSYWNPFMYVDMDQTNGAPVSDVFNITLDWSPTSSNVGTSQMFDLKLTEDFAVAGFTPITDARQVMYIDATSTTNVLIEVDTTSSGGIMKLTDRDTTSATDTVIIDNYGTGNTLSLKDAGVETASISATGVIMGNQLNFDDASQNITTSGSDVVVTTPENFVIHNDTIAKGLSLVNDNDTAGGVIIQMDHNSASPAASDVLFSIQAIGNDDVGTDAYYARIHAFVNDTASQSTRAEMRFSVAAGGGDTPTSSDLNKMLVLDGTNRQVGVWQPLAIATPSDENVTALTAHNVNSGTASIAIFRSTDTTRFEVEHDGDIMDSVGSYYYIRGEATTDRIEHGTATVGGDQSTGSVTFANAFLTAPVITCSVYNSVDYTSPVYCGHNGGTTANFIWALNADATGTVHWQAVGAN